MPNPNTVLNFYKNHFFSYRNHFFAKYFVASFENSVKCYLWSWIKLKPQLTQFLFKKRASECFDHRHLWVTLIGSALCTDMSKPSRMNFQSSHLNIQFLDSSYLIDQFYGVLIWLASFLTLETGWPISLTMQSDWSILLISNLIGQF